MRNNNYFLNASQEEKLFLENYDCITYERPSVTSDIVIFTVNPKGNLCVVLIKRGDYPYKGHWALPGGFLQVNSESVGECAARELKEETGLNNMFLEQLKTYSDPNRDPRMHVISVAHYALIPYSQISLVAGDDAKECELFEIDINRLETGEMYLVYKNIKNNFTVIANDLAFDHNLIISDAIKRLDGRKDYCLDLFNLLENKSEFTVSSFKRIYDAVSFNKSDNANFRKMFNNRYVKTGIVKYLDKKTNSSKPAMLYEYMGGN